MFFFSEHHAVQQCNWFQCFALLVGCLERQSACNCYFSCILQRFLCRTVVDHWPTQGKPRNDHQNGSMNWINELFLQISEERWNWNWRQETVSQHTSQWDRTSVNQDWTILASIRNYYQPIYSNWTVLCSWSSTYRCLTGHKMIVNRCHLTTVT